MKNILAIYSLTVSLVAIAVSAFAGSALAATSSAAPVTCAAALSFGYTRDSASFSINDGSVAPSRLDERLDDARKAIRLVANKVGCAVSELGLAAKGIKANDACVELVPGNSASVSCYVEGTDGYYFVTRDMLENTTVVFNRWD